MAALGADVYVNDISQESNRIVDELNEKCDFRFPIKFIKGDFLEAEIIHNYYDVVVGKAFIHHLTNEQEIEFIKRIVLALKPYGVVRFVEPAVNSKILDEIRWLIPVPGRPSKLQRNKFKQWKSKDTHPERDNSSYHYMKIGKDYFGDCRIVPIGAIERFCRFFPNKYNRQLRRLAYVVERYLPNTLNLTFARAQLIEYRLKKNKKI